MSGILMASEVSQLIEKQLTCLFVSSMSVSTIFFVWASLRYPKASSRVGSMCSLRFGNLILASRDSLRTLSRSLIIRYFQRYIPWKTAAGWIVETTLRSDNSDTALIIDPRHLLIPDFP